MSGAFTVTEGNTGDLAIRFGEAQTLLRRSVLGPGFQPLPLVQVFDLLGRIEFMRAV